MAPDPKRISLIREELQKARLDGLICSLPPNVLMLSGYWPVVGTSVAIASADGKVIVLAPKDEEVLAKQGRADEVRTFEPSSLSDLRTAADALKEPLIEAVRELKLDRARLGLETSAAWVPAPYAGFHVYGAQLEHLIASWLPQARLASADDLLAELRSIKSDLEIQRIADACDIAARAFQSGISAVKVGACEAEVTFAFRQFLMAPGDQLLDKHRADGFVYCMSGPNAAQAYASFQRSRSRKLMEGDLVLVHCNSYLDGFWTDITRTYCLGTPNDRQRKMYDAIFEARGAALEAIKPGIEAFAVDRAARQVMKKHGFGDQFRHPTGHGVGFAAIDHNAIPRLHPKSRDVLKVGMVFNVEPGIYFEGECGMRHCDVATVTSSGAKVLTDFYNQQEKMVIDAAAPAREPIARDTGF